MAFNIWRITDGKAGHDSQSIGLCNAIESLQPCKRFDIPADNFLANGKNLVLKQFPRSKDLSSPDIIIGAGHGTHFPMLCAKRARGGKTIVLMKPSLPLSFFDFAIIPKHDSTASQENIIITSGALNPMQFNNNKLANTGLILLGGPSKHFRWDSDAILNQISHIVTHNTDIHWTVADSPRTPSNTLNNIVELAFDDIEILNVAETDSETLQKYIYTSEYIWVTMDSVSMIYESLSSGAAVGLLEVKQKNQNRISSAIKALIDEKQLTTFEIWNNTHELIYASFKFNEAERCASLLLERGLLA
ncbi:MAG TPA: nucleoside-diphosphate sugar epimerase [Thiotrichaceae bacterium]|jgi:mitochondrial fission protein ELM1|nr:nucleoside-diphosphate sugar epimerase [Thiotrichaceae bacterium]